MEKGLRRNEKDAPRVAGASPVLSWSTRPLLEAYTYLEKVPQGLREVKPGTKNLLSRDTKREKTMKNKKTDNVWQTCSLLLEKSGFSVDVQAASRCEAYFDLLREGNDFFSLVSRGDLETRLPMHMADSLSLAGYVHQYGGGDHPWLDIGPGGGFPSIPLKIVFPGLRVVLAERSVKKIGFLRKVVGLLDLSGIEIRHGEFPVVVKDLMPGVITARAVEKSARVHLRLWKYMHARRDTVRPVFLCQSGALEPKGMEGFHVEHVRDAWTHAGLRRGTLDLIREEAP
jgi:16S rRNA G527 N7-methylase RsmG